MNILNFLTYVWLLFDWNEKVPLHFEDIHYIISFKFRYSVCKSCSPVKESKDYQLLNKAFQVT